jgi:ribulose-5-phosphate 4-epimerase/fuculose-1-phosphate aldolase
MANHGVVCIGENLENVFEVARTLELACANFIASKKVSKS